VNGVRGINGKPERPLDFFVGAGAIERTTAEHGLATLDLELRGGHDYFTGSVTVVTATIPTTGVIDTTSFVRVIAILL